MKLVRVETLDDFKHCGCYDLMHPMPGLCPALTSVLKSCSDDGCTVLAGGMLSRTPSCILLGLARLLILTFHNLVYLSKRHHFCSPNILGSMTSMSWSRTCRQYCEEHHLICVAACCPELSVAQHVDVFLSVDHLPGGRIVMMTATRWPH